MRHLKIGDNVPIIPKGSRVKLNNSEEIEVYDNKIDVSTDDSVRITSIRDGWFIWGARYRWFKEEDAVMSEISVKDFFRLYKAVGNLMPSNMFDKNDGKIYITYGLYNYLRKHNNCDDLLDEIFGKDVEDCPYEDGELILVRNSLNELWSFRFSNGKLIKGMAMCYLGQCRYGETGRYKYHQKITEEI